MEGESALSPAAKSFNVACQRCRKRKVKVWLNTQVTRMRVNNCSVTLKPRNAGIVQEQELNVSRPSYRLAVLRIHSLQGRSSLHPIERSMRSG